MSSKQLKGKGKKGPSPAELRLAELRAKEEEEADRLRLKEEEKVARKKAKQEEAEQAHRAEQLIASINMINGVIKQCLEAAWQERQNIEWVQYLKCDGLPDPCFSGQMNTYLELWDHMIDKTTIDDAKVRTKEVLKLMNELTSFIDSPLGASTSELENWRWTLQLFREHQKKNLNTASYKILRNVFKNMVVNKLVTATYNVIENDFTICLWTMVTVPKSYPNPRAPPRPRVEVDFPQIKMHVLLPTIIDGYLLVLRAMYLKYDHLSDRSDSYQEPPIPPEYNQDIYKATLNEQYSALIYKYEQYCIIKQAAGEKVPTQTYNRETGEMPKVPYVRMQITPSTHVIAEENVLYSNIRQKLVLNVDPGVINLRKYVILGGIFSLELFFQPPQPQPLITMELEITRLLVPKTLKEVKFRVPYKPPPPPKVKEKVDVASLEVENKKFEAEMDKLIFVSLHLPEHVMWLDTPIICQWQKDKNIWSTTDVYDFKYLEETTSVTFRTTTFGSFAFAVNRYTNFPFQTWDLKPEKNGTVTFQITAAILVIDFNIKESNVCITSVQNAPTNILKQYYGKYYKLPQLKRILLEVGVDVFPWFDAFSYIQESYEKQWPMEKHVYFQMAQLCSLYNFSWSRWNTVAGRRSIVMQMREFKPQRAKQGPFSMLHITPLKAQYITATEVSSSFSPDPVQGMIFYADLYSLFKGTCNMIQRTKVHNASPVLIGAVAELLQATRVLSLC